jgi:hypothetical protein
MLRRAVWQKYTNISEVLTASVIRVLIVLLMQAVNISEAMV